MPVYAFLNWRHSCYMDSVLVAMFAPPLNHVFSRVMLHPKSDWDTRIAPVQWFTAFQHALVQEIQLLRGKQSETHGWRITEFRALMQHVVSQNGINFALPQQQSAIDFVRYLLHLFGLEDKLITMQRSTTFYKRRAAVEPPKRSVGELVRVWLSSPVVKRWDASNAATLPDESERRSLEADTSGKAVLLENEEGDRRRVDAPEGATLMLCQLTAEDDQGTEQVSIARDVVPHVESIGGSGYTGPFSVKVMATRLMSCHVLIFEVARKIMFSDNGSWSERKSARSVHYGDYLGNEVILTIHGQRFMLQSVVCHVGSAQGGHYVAFVQETTTTGAHQWYFYDDAHPKGELQPLQTASDMERIMAAAPSRTGELFFYVPMQHE